MKNITQYDEIYPIWSVINGEPYLLSIFYTGYADVDMWDNATLQPGWGAVHEIKSEDYYLILTGTTDGAAKGDLKPAESLKSNAYCLSALEYLLEKAWLETGSVNMTISGTFYVVRENFDDESGNFWILYVTESQSKVLIVTRGETIGGVKSTLCVSETDWKDEIPDNYEEYALAVLEFDFQTQVNE